MAQTNGTNGHSQSQIPTTIPLWINGVEETLTSTFPVINPATNKHLYDCSSASISDADRAISSAQAAFKSWAKTKPATRRDIFLRAASILESRAEEYSQFMEEETGSQQIWSRGINLPGSIGMLKDIAGRIATVESRVITVAGEGKSAMILKEPYGVILGIAPWNAPYILGIRACAYAIATGNTVVLKGPELSPRVYWAIGKAFHDAGLPAGVLNILLYRAEDAASVTKHLVESPLIKKVNFTGSTAIGAIIAEQCGRSLKPCLMELGGKNSAIVLEDADLDLAAQKCALGSLLHAGQICMSTDRIIVQRSVADEFRKKLFEAFGNVAPGDQDAPCLVSAAGVGKTRKIVDESVKAGGHVVYGSQGEDETSQDSKARMRPIVVDGIKKGMPLYADEAFGPAVGIIEIDALEEAVEIMNDTGYGLSASVFSRDLRKALKVARDVESGAVHINDMTVHDEPSLPHGGIGKSGWGRFNSQDGLDEFLKSKTVTWDD